jgi:hypothetical protein
VHPEPAALPQPQPRPIPQAEPQEPIVPTQPQRVPANTEIEPINVQPPKSDVNTPRNFVDQSIFKEARRQEKFLTDLRQALEKHHQVRCLSISETPQSVTNLLGELKEINAHNMMFKLAAVIRKLTAFQKLENEGDASSLYKQFFLRAQTTFPNLVILSEADLNSPSLTL